MNVLVTGGAGYIGSVVVEELLSTGGKVVVVDDLSKGHRNAVPDQVAFVEGNIRDHQLMKEILIENQIEAVVHMAASSLVGESVKLPDKYFDNNVTAAKAMLDAMRVTGVNKIVFSSTAAVYGEPKRQPITESDALAPTNPYGASKLEFERELQRQRDEYGLVFTSLRYFNAAGATSRCGEQHDPETHLIPIVLQAAMGQIPSVGIFGDDYLTPDGTCVRDYIHVRDLARAHVLALKDLDGSKTYNLGCGGDGYSVRQVINAACDITGRKITETIMARREGDPAVLIASSEKIRRELGWEPEFQDLGVIIRSAWTWTIAPGKRVSHSM
ncbi:MAG TPA: UDP-glucose 4-epimerase GalE [Pyrinomonadaceae bacterium]|jgi:UDP-glucose 4-epimerase|nr:UDP-glucose 4-epimerase GalE [Pyrinomonadaceae bacterium]